MSRQSNYRQKRLVTPFALQRRPDTVDQLNVGQLKFGPQKKKLLESNSQLEIKITNRQGGERENSSPSPTLWRQNVVAVEEDYGPLSPSLQPPRPDSLVRGGRFRFSPKVRALPHHCQRRNSLFASSPLGSRLKDSSLLLLLISLSPFSKQESVPTNRSCAFPAMTRFTQSCSTEKK